MTHLASLDGRDRAEAQRCLAFLGRGPAAVLSAYSVRDFERAWRRGLSLHGAHLGCSVRRSLARACSFLAGRSQSVE
jgi:hypothetical protein